MKETSRVLTNFAAIAFLVRALAYRQPCRINIAVGKRLKITVVEEANGTLGRELENV